MGNLQKFHKAVKQEGLRYSGFRATEQIIAQLPGTSTAYWQVAPRYYTWKFSRQFLEYDCPVSPCQHLWVNPNSIKNKSDRSSTSGIGRRKKFIGISDGKWDENTKKLDGPKIQGLYDRFVHGKKWEETELFEHCMTVIDQQGEDWHGCTDREDVLARCEKIEGVYTNMEKNGYKTQLELRHTTGVTDYVDALINEILVDIGRDGELLYVTGKHRLTITKILGLDRIPVICDHRHSEWMKKRDQLYANNKDGAHPDI